MSKRIPVCAFCGEKLTHPRAMIDFSWCPGGPRIGWHQECIAKDEDTFDAAFDAALESSSGGRSQDGPPIGKMPPVLVDIFKKNCLAVTYASSKGSKERFEEAMDKALMGPHY